jgi:hypothetical protein
VVQLTVCDSGDRMPTAVATGPVTPMPTERDHTALPIPNPCDTSSVVAPNADDNRDRP